MYTYRSADLSRGGSRTLTRTDMRHHMEETKKTIT